VRSSQQNAPREITGLLLHGQHTYVPGAPGAFVQWLEGPEDTIRALHASICRDERHTEIETLAEGPVRDLAGQTGRLFPEWEMDVQSISELPATLSGFLCYVRDRRAEATDRWALAA
jgi:hypothetical protein